MSSVVRKVVIERGAPRVVKISNGAIGMRVPSGGSTNEVLTKTGSGDSDYDWQAAGAGSDTAAIHDNVASEISAITEKASPVNADLVIIEDSADSNNKKKVQLGNLPGGGGAVDSVHGRTGAVVSADGDYTQSEITGLKTSDSPQFTGLTIEGASITLNETDGATDGGKMAARMLAGENSGVLEVYAAGVLVSRLPGGNVSYINNGYPVILNASSTSANDPQLVIGGTESDVDGNSHGFVHEQTYTKTSSGLGINSVDCDVTITSGVDLDHYAGVQSRPEINLSAGTAARVVGFQDLPDIESATTIRRGLELRDPTGAGALANNVGLFIETLARGGTTNYAITIGDSDADQNLIHVGVAGNPLLSWDESEDSFKLSHGLILDSNTLNLGGTGTGNVQIKAIADVLKARNGDDSADADFTCGGLTAQGTISATASIYASKGADVASAGALTLGTDGNYFDVTGTTSITSITTIGAGTTVILQFDAALTLTHHATNLILPGGANITTAAGDHAIFTEYDSGWRCVAYTKADGTPLAGGGGLSNVVEDTTPQLGGHLDINGQVIGDGTRELLTFTEDGSAVNHVDIENEAAGNGPKVKALGDDTNIDLNLEPKGSGDLKTGGNRVANVTDILWKPTFVLHNSAGLTTAAVSPAIEVPAEISDIDEIRIQARDGDGALVSTTATIDVRSKSWSSGAYTDASSGDNLSGTQPALSAETSDYVTSPGLGSLTSGNMLQLALSAITGTGTKTIQVQLICS